MDYNYEIPTNFDSVLNQVLIQLKMTNIASALQNCTYEYTNVGNAYYAGIKGDNWDMNALDFKYEGNKVYISKLKPYVSEIKNAINVALDSKRTGLMVRNVFFIECNDSKVIPQSDNDRLKQTLNISSLVLDDLIKAGESMCLNVLFCEERTENEINDYLRDMLCNKDKYEVKDQTRHGLSFNEKDAGEVDILLKKDDREIAIIEGIKLSCIDKQYINNHIRKLVVNYNALGTPAFLINYVFANDFLKFSEKYYEYLNNYKYPLKVDCSLQKLSNPNAATRVFKVILERDMFAFPLYFILFNINSKIL